MQRVIVIVIACAASPALAQDPQVWLHLSFTEVDAVTGLPVPNPNGIIEPGEAARLSVSASFVPTVGTSVSDPTLPSGAWAVHAFRGLLNYRVQTPEAGSWTDLRFGTGWTGEYGWIDPSGVRAISLGQEAAGADQGNPVHNLFEAIWTPGDYTARVGHFSVAPDGIFTVPARLWLVDTASPGTYTTWSVVATYAGTVHIPIVPAPGTLPAIFVGLALATRRRRAAGRS